MARLARITLAGYPHHVVQRGSGERRVFEAPDDYRRYLGWLGEGADRYGLDIWAYCLMPNHVHFVCVPRMDGALAKTFNAIHMRYAQYFNGKRDAAGQLWRPRFMSCILDDPSVREEIRFVETNPVRAGLVSRAEDYPWSSARSHVTGEPDSILDGGPPTSEIGDWNEYLSAGGDESILCRGRQCLKRGRPSGAQDFVRKLEEIVGRRLEALPRGRPRKRQPLSLMGLTSAPEEPKEG